VELRASLPVHVSQKSKVYLRPAPPLTVVAPFFKKKTSITIVAEACM
jgi:hypothetical protein